MGSGKNIKFTEGIKRLKQPILPLVKMVEFLYLTGPCKTVSEVLGRLMKPVTLEGLYYENPQQLLQPYESVMQDFAVIKGEKKLTAGFPFIVNEKQVPLARRQSVECWVMQQILDRELEDINSMLCGSCGCVLCCTGPDSKFDPLSGFKGKMKQEYFEIPLTDSEVDLFALARVDNGESRARTAQSSHALHVNHVAFYKHEMALYHWQNGWSLILPRGAACPQLAEDTKRCMIYTKRPEVCRKPQIFPFILEKTAEMAKRSDGVQIPVYMARHKVLAVWDCPYVRELQDEIGAYAEMSGLEPIFKRSKT
jgi:Fe-S-cluster containining protein